MRPGNRVCQLTQMSGEMNSFRTGISLHCHTQHSREVLDFIPYYASRIPFVKERFERIMRDYHRDNGRAMDFTRAYWTPPLLARQVFDLESQQIADRLALPPASFNDGSR